VGRRDGGGHPSSPVVTAFLGGVAAWLKLRNPRELWYHYTHIWPKINVLENRIYKESKINILNNNTIFFSFEKYFSFKY
jgi:hypothetical protein